MKVTITWLQNHLGSDSFLRCNKWKITLFTFHLLVIVNVVYEFSRQILKGCEVPHE